ncbi:hypothetical protein [Chryseobacterium arthrosphaerae]|uniref:hypothetical protein n=1 Tax=Chryseobacterium arthrosphaerae TaxID=651561 RepID=UPI001F4B304B|nr:hypothetical protein [Chryseobacterium arthrosphaerae]
MENIDKIIEDIQAQGSKTFKLFTLTSLLLGQNLHRLRENRIEELRNLIEPTEIYTYPSFEEILAKPIRGKSTVTLTLKEIKRTTVFFHTEKELENYIFSKKVLQNQLGLNENIDKQSKLYGSKDKVDFVGVKKKVKHLIEIKHKSSYYGIEQLIRYKGVLGEQNAKMILITGIEDPKIHNTFSGMHKEQRDFFKWYYYNWDGNTFELIKIKI